MNIYYLQSKASVLEESNCHEDPVNYRLEDMSQEALYDQLVTGIFREDAFNELFERLRRLVVYQARGYMLPMSMDEDDMCQEAMILLWRIIMKRSYTHRIGKFSTFFYQCWQNTLDNLWKKYVLSNPVPISYEWNWHFNEPLGDTILQWSASAETYRKKAKQYNQRWLQKKANAKELEAAA